MCHDDHEARPRVLDTVENVYRRAFQRYGATHEGVGWIDPEGQRLRFQILAQLCGPEAAGGGMTVIDLGSGYGAMFEMLADHPALAGGRYIGYDMSADFIAAARQRLADPRASFVQGHAPGEAADYAFASGTYNIKMLNPTDSWREYIEASLRDLWAKSRRGLAFNMMGPEAEPREHTFYYGDPDYFAGFCRGEMTENIELRDDYGLPEWTLFVRR